jgi:predicted nucleic acid-binding protein
VGALSHQAADSALQVFRRDWPDLVRIQATDMLIARADTLAWDLNLRGYDAVHLALALLWQDSLGRRVTLATFDPTLWRADKQQGLTPFPDDLPGWLAERRR